MADIETWTSGYDLPGGGDASAGTYGDALSIFNTVTGAAANVGSTILGFRSTLDALNAERANLELTRYRTQAAVDIERAKTAQATLAAQQGLALSNPIIVLSLIAAGVFLVARSK